MDSTFLNEGTVHSGNYDTNMEKNKKYVILFTLLKVLFFLFCLRKQCVNKRFQLGVFSEFYRI